MPEGHPGILIIVLQLFFPNQVVQHVQQQMHDLMIVHGEASRNKDASAGWPPVLWNG